MLARVERKEDDARLWSARLRDLGLRIADALVEMGELETANRHLDSLPDSDTSHIIYRKACRTICSPKSSHTLK